MTDWVQVAVAGDVTEGEELQRILQAAGIDSEVHGAVAGADEHGDEPLRILVHSTHVDAARDAIEALSEPDELIDED